MGRHAAPPPHGRPEGSGPTSPSAPGPRPSRTGGQASTWTDRALLAGITSLATGGVVLWVGAGWWAAATTAVGVAAVVLAATWLAARGAPGTPSPPSRDPVQ